MKLINAVQYPMTFSGTFNYEDLGVDGSVAIDVPPGFVLTAVAVAVDVVFNGTTPAFNVVDNMASPNTIIASTVLTAAAATTAVAGELFNYYPAGGRFTFNLTGGAGATAGSGRILLQGIVQNRQNERSGI